MSHALWETTEPYYPDRSHGPVDFNDYLMPGPGDIAPHHISILERPGQPMQVVVPYSRGRKVGVLTPRSEAEIAALKAQVGR